MILLKNKVAIVTGSTAGIGAGIAKLFAQLGAHVVVTSRTMKNAEQTVEEIRSAGGDASPCVFDIDEPSTIPDLLQRALNIDGRIDILVNNALSRSSMAPQALQDMEYAQLKKGITSNLTNLLALTTAAYPHLRCTKGVVVNIGSAVVNRHISGVALYSILKGALCQTTKILASDWARDGIRVNQINPGFVSTDSMLARRSEETARMMIEGFKKLHPLGRVGEAEDVAALAAFLVSDHASWITGAVIDIDGGFSVQGASFSSSEDMK